MLKDFKKSKDWQEIKMIFKDFVEEEKKQIAYRNVDDRIVGQEYKAMRIAKNIVSRVIKKVENQTEIKQKPKRLI